MEAQLLDAVRADRDADGPRLVYADWLEAAGTWPQRAELVRIQLRRARLPEWDPEHVGLEVDELCWAKEHAAAWRAELPQPPGVTWGQRVRGFVHHAAFEDLDLARQHVSACRSATVLDSLSLSWSEASESLPVPPDIRALTLRCGVDALAPLRHLAEGGTPTSLRSLTLQVRWLRDRSFRRLVASPMVSALERLDMPHHELGDRSIFELVEHGRLPALRVLDVTAMAAGDVITSAGVDALSTWSGGLGLRALDLANNDVGEALPRFLASETMSGLRSLGLAGDGPLSLEGFTDAHQALRLEHLDLSLRTITEVDAVALAEAPCLSTLRRLKLCVCLMEDGAIRRLARAPWFDGLRVLDVSSTMSPTRRPGRGWSSTWLPVLAERDPEHLHTLLFSEDGQNLSTLADSPLGDRLLRITPVKLPVVEAMLDTLREHPAAFGRLRWLSLFAVGPKARDLARGFAASSEARRLDVLDGYEIPLVRP